MLLGEIAPPSASLLRRTAHGSLSRARQLTFRDGGGSPFRDGGLSSQCYKTVWANGEVRCPEATVGTLRTGGIVPKGVCTVAAGPSVQSPSRTRSPVYKASCVERPSVQSPFGTGSPERKVGGAHWEDLSEGFAQRHASREVPENCWRSVCVWIYVFVPTGVTHFRLQMTHADLGHPTHSHMFGRSGGGISDSAGISDRAG